MAIKKSKKRWIIPGVLVILAGATAVGFVVMSRPEVEIDDSRLGTVERGDIARSVVATGRIEPITKIEVKSKANGIIKELRVQVGDIVQPGSVLAELDKEDLAARVREAEAALLSAQSNLQAAAAQLQKNKVEAEGPDVPFTKRNYERSEKLMKEGVLPQQSYEDSRSAYELALNRQNIARAQLTVSEAKVSQAKADVAQAQAAVDRSKEELNYTTIRSPIHGMVLSRDVEIGSPVSSILNMGSAATLVMVLGDISQVYVRGKVDEADIGVVRLGQPSRIKVETFKDKTFEGKVTEISPLGVDKENVVTFEVKVSIKNPGGELRANMTANAEIVLDEHLGTLLIPESAVIYDAKRNATVEVPAAGKPNGREKKSIRVGISNGTRTEVLSGLEQGDKVVLQ
ncbi:MAG: efflux RND transporter periplasmic adaptor subunit [Acidobacteriota bacterium]|nr:MAG: efflux RND transporter periplasmic adaptor subunit [Acidobacteriota bacterium]